MAENSTLNDLALDYRSIVKQLVEKDKVSPETVLDCLVTRDKIAHHLDEKGPADKATARLITEGDILLRKKLTTPLVGITQLEDWHKSLSPPSTAWWWFEPFSQLLPWYKQLDWFWTTLSIILLTISLSLIVDMVPRFLSGGPDSVAAFAVIVQSLLTLLSGGTILTSTGQKIAKRFYHKISRWFSNHLKWLRNKTFSLDSLQEEIGFVLALALILGLLWLRFYGLALIARYYNNWGIDDYKAGQLITAQHKFERALKLNPDYIRANYNLGNLYEDLNDLEGAKEQYQIAAQGNLPEAQNNLARLYILAGEPDKAIPLLFRAFLVDLDHAETRYKLYKNLGWARLEQGRYIDAERELEMAINIGAQLEDEGAPARCLLARLYELEGIRPENEITQAWEDCLAYADPSRPDEDIWIGMGQDYFEQQNNTP